ncbi:hypothetical protein LSCM4_02456 [Leishmania orientalis]|uniref:Uncharacterized protein n=1 Tax=Leishmania orientalis TaxID=2249476 RepID=A0A836H2A9_9TRYP|nr:hypothetical protein LSCM4_02456 [Leishmania orientalis]
MSIIYVDELAIRLPSDVRNIFNPLCAFGSSNINNRSSAPVMGLREVQTGHVLLPIDAEGSIVVTPGQRYSVVLVRETRGGSAASAAAPPAGTESSSVVSNGHQSSADDNANRKNNRLASVKLQQQQLLKQASLSLEAAAAAPEAEPPMPFPQKSMSKKERKAARESVITKQFHGFESSSVPTVAAPEQARKKQKRQDDDAALAPQQQPPYQQKSSPNATARVEAVGTDDAPLMEAYKSSQSHTSRISPVMEPSKSGESSRHSSKRGSPRSKAETVAVLPPPIRHSLSSSDGYDGDGAPSLAQLYSVKPAASQPSITELQHAGEGEARPTVTAKKRRSTSDKKSKSASSDAAAPETGLRAPSPLQPTTSAAMAAAAQTQYQKSASPDRVPVTLPLSSRASTVRRVPLDTSSDSD